MSLQKTFVFSVRNHLPIPFLMPKVTSTPSLSRAQGYHGPLPGTGACSCLQRPISIHASGLDLVLPALMAKTSYLRLRPPIRISAVPLRPIQGCTSPGPQDEPDLLPISSPWLNILQHISLQLRRSGADTHRPSLGVPLRLNIPLFLTKEPS